MRLDRAWASSASGRRACRGRGRRGPVTAVAADRLPARVGPLLSPARECSRRVHGHVHRLVAEASDSVRVVQFQGEVGEERRRRGGAEESPNDVELDRVDYGLDVPRRGERAQPHEPVADAVGLGPADPAGPAAAVPILVAGGAAAAAGAAATAAAAAAAAAAAVALGLRVAGGLDEPQEDRRLEDAVRVGVVVLLQFVRERGALEDALVDARPRHGERHQAGLALALLAPGVVRATTQRVRRARDADEVEARGGEDAHQRGALRVVAVLDDQGVEGGVGEVGLVQRAGELGRGVGLDIVERAEEGHGARRSIKPCDQPKMAPYFPSNVQRSTVLRRASVASSPWSCGNAK